MGRLLFAAITSLDGYVEDESGSFDWSAPDEEVHAFVNDQSRDISTYLFGRRMYEVMQVWQTMGDEPTASPAEVDYAELWRNTDKVVYSTTLTEPSTPRTRIESLFETDAVRAMTASTDGDISVGGPELAAHAFRAGLVDVVSLYLNPVVVGGGKQALPDGVRMDLDLVTAHRFSNGVVYLEYRVRA